MIKRRLLNLVVRDRHGNRLETYEDARKVLEAEEALVDAYFALHPMNDDTA